MYTEVMLESLGIKSNIYQAKVSLSNNERMMEKC